MNGTICRAVEAENGNGTGVLLRGQNTFSKCKRRRIVDFVLDGLIINKKEN
jgi:hypothetical protein